MISECNYKTYLLMHAHVILCVTFFQYFQVICAVNKIVLCIIVYYLFKVVGPQRSHNVACTINVFIINEISYQI